MTAVKIASVHAAALAGLVLLALAGLLQKALAGGGAFVGILAGIAAAHAVVGIRAARALDRYDGNVEKARNAVTWLEYLDSAALIIGFLGTLTGAIFELTHLDPTVSGAAMAAMLKQVLHGVGIAIYSLLAGTVVGLWTSAATRILSNATEIAAAKAHE